MIPMEWRMLIDKDDVKNINVWVYKKKILIKTNS